MIALCLQTCPLDCNEALSLIKLICDIEPVKREDGEFFLVYRKDTPLHFARDFVRLASQKFGTVAAREARNFDAGWPAGSNMLAGSAFIEMVLLQREGLCKADGFLLFEPDCIPLLADWIDQLAEEWRVTCGQNREACGHWHQQFDETTLHMNGNAIFRTDWFDRHPNWIIGAGTMGWDYFFKDQILSVSRDSNLIYQLYNTHGFTFEQFNSVTKNGERPAFLHGVKTPEARQIARTLLVKAQESACV